MEDVTNIILTYFLSDDDKLEQLNQLLGLEGDLALLSCADKRFDPPWYGGEKHLETNIALGAYRDLDLDALVAAIERIEWYDPEDVQLFVCRGPARRFTEIPLGLPPAEEDE